MLVSEIVGELSPFESLVRDIEIAFGDPSVQFQVFWEDIYQVPLQRQISFVPHKFKCEPSGEAGALFNEFLTVETRHHGDTLADTWDMRVRSVNAVRRVLKGASVATDGFYGNFFKDPFQAGIWIGDVRHWTINSVIVQNYVWQLPIPRLDNTYPATVRQINVVDATQITTTEDGVLTPSEQLEIKE